MNFHPFSEYIHLARDWNLISYIYHNYAEHSLSNCSHTHTHIPLYTFSSISLLGQENRLITLVIIFI